MRIEARIEKGRSVMALILVCVESGKAIPLAKPVMLVGRSPECDIQLDSKKISRRHCCIAVVDEQLAVRDLGSMNGVRINGERVVDGRLKLNDELMIGNLRYRVKYQPKEPPARPSRSRQVSPAGPSSQVDLLAPDGHDLKSGSRNMNFDPEGGG